MFVPKPWEKQNKQQAEWKVKVLNTYKGCIPRRIVLVSSPGVCQARLTVGVTFLFTLRAPLAGGKYRISLCTPYQRWTKVDFYARRHTLAIAIQALCPPKASRGIFRPATRVVLLQEGDSTQRL